MGSISVIEGSFPKQTASILDKSFFVPKAVMSIKTTQKEVRFYNLRAALRSVETIIEHKSDPTVKIILADGGVIIGKVDQKGFTTLKVALAMGTDSEEVIFVPTHKKAQADKPGSIWSQQFKVSPSFAFFTIGLLIFFMYMASGDSSTPSNGASRQVDDNTLKAIAQTLCKDSVKAGLRSPSTAEFPWTAGAISHDTNTDTVVYSSYVDAQNGFGATIRTHFTCSLLFTGANMADVSDWRVQKLETH